jgi:hypothetical protein
VKKIIHRKSTAAGFHFPFGFNPALQAACNSFRAKDSGLTLSEGTNEKAAGTMVSCAQDNPVPN